MTHSIRRWVIPAIALTGTVLAGCGRQDASGEAVSGARLDPTVIQEQQRNAEANQRRRANADQQVAQAPAGSGETATGAARVTDTINDATITAEVNAGLAADSKLSAMRIDVDTRDGVVTLTGPAPDDAARLKATEIAASPKGVVRVENRLAVQ